MDNKAWFKQAKFGMFIHWGLYCLPAGEWKGERTDWPAEWLQTYYRIPCSEYEKLAQAFNPVFFDAEEWVCLAKEAGMQYIVLTAKHKEGFAMFQSDADAFNVVDATPFGRDVVGEMADACRRHGLKFGVYYAQEQDFREEHGGGSTRIDPKFGCTWGNTWDFPDNSKKDLNIMLEKKTKPQVTELLTKYGDFLVMWFDDPCDITYEQSKALVDLVKQLQPDCLVPSRVGNGLGDIHSFGDNTLDAGDCREGLWESPVTMNGSWGYKPYDNDFKSADEILAIKERLNGQGVNLLLNVGPDYLGRIPAPCQKILKEVGRKLREAKE